MKENVLVAHETGAEVFRVSCQHLPVEWCGKVLTAGEAQ